MSKESTKAALDRFFTKDASRLDREMNGTTRKNERPEMELTQKPCKSWFRKNGWAMFIIDAKAEWSDSAQAYVAASVDAGFSDAVGCTPDGTAAFVEFKAPGKRSTLKPHQREFLKDKIQKGCFSVCVDSVESLELAWTDFQRHRKNDRRNSTQFLFKHLPAEPVSHRPKADASGLPF
jgi:hypothetical protein